MMRTRIPRVVPQAGRRLASSVTATKKQEVIFSGIQPTGTPHLGNYLGLFLPFLDLQSSSNPSTPIYLSVVGLHSITLPQNPTQLISDRRNMLAALLACGVDPNRTTLYLQEQVPQHAELAWYFNTISSVGRLQRMTTWKSRLAVSRNANSEDEVSEADLRLGLFAYPVLQAADIALYKGTLVPVGEDQTQHLELARDTNEAFNRAFGDVFPIPDVQIVPQKRILSLKNPAEKMSKSAPNPASRISITDSSKDIEKRIKGAVTDADPNITFDPTGRPGVANLLTIWSALDDAGRTPGQLAEMAAAEGWGAGKLKGAVAEVVVHKLAPVRDEYARIVADPGYIRDVAARGAERARETAEKTMVEVRRVVGLGDI
ncbi:hypothetical protein CcaverHIS002_0112750 [Cutaneotrichosporon cavernicola]|uniref:tryptophan--tRNA ligase n=1 Tax=Cutaneotrichosporon cavernicola TaxID=279322 RepID=A0AA48I2U3_9TREE|nr:uncharacterized protein CcaverHIS019_0112620 [Cutaneotrichosporon cavernicola]BEI80746.1 hypothetical protein CcaverHIS002_0112750 [Cutaneotrichosporon cavernicola]BEI88544.1 hypothetical protein CcaverHIS019_0112620 [Cutaneotrichosporon cavernicola]BEI96317.1 hypothetical protein CcaverHIS631_0112660 [Cutaneotrichosporon cavernicola]BEJ04088.1 hypothetical protein CcaverHIS641_0112630 [Cutaneotrichosporon cavernicola]